MTSTPPDAPTGPPSGPTGHPHDGGPRATRDEIRDLGRLRRSVTERKIAGVAGGLARHLDIDPLVVRVALVVLVFFGGAGLILYGACWLLVPEEGRQTAPLGLDDRSRSVALVIVGALAALSLVGDLWGPFGFPWPLAVIALVVVLLLTRKDRARTTPPAGTPYAPPPGAPYDPQGPTQDPTQDPAPSPAYGTAPSPASPYAASPYAVPAGPVPPVPPVAYVAPARPRSPRKRGPILFWFTLALIALAEGMLGIVDLAGAPVAEAAYPALAVLVSGLMLLVGAFYGRAGGLILVGLLSTLALAITTAAGEWEGTTLRSTPTTAASVDDTYDISSGELVLDLRHVGNVAALDGRTIRVTADVGHLEVIVPFGLNTVVHGDVNGPGNISLFGEQNGGIDITMTRERFAAPDAPTLTIDAELSVGEIEVHQ